MAFPWLACRFRTGMEVNEILQKVSGIHIAPYCEQRSVKCTHKNVGCANIFSVLF